MTRYLFSPPSECHAARVESFSGGEDGFSSIPLRSSGCLVRASHASVGATDVMARRGDYLLHPVPGFVSGYDVVGVLERVDGAGSALGLQVGQRVAGILPRMGAHATWLTVPGSLLVPVPEALPSAVAATLPLDAVTAKHAIDLLKPGVRTLFIQGVGGAVGVLAAQLVAREGIAVIGTASAASGPVAQRYGAVVVDYRDPDWPQQVLAHAGPVDGAIDHTGSRDLRALVAPGGRIVRTAFGGKIGRQKRATAVGFARTLMRRFASPSEVACSVPMYVAARRSAYRRDLRAALDLAAGGELRPLEPELHRAEGFADALRAAGRSAPGQKVVLEFERG
ncbi:MAG TPA: hypothetical protein PKE40_04730 [Arachnia sp.]|nr:hypothetical protein [Arachnia sp.]HMT85637.1 hypothetical protein [Arachnia sp.]